MSAIRVARAATKRDKILKFKGCYHGHTDSLLVDAGSGALTLGIPSSPGVPKGVASDTLVANYNDLDSVKHLFRTHRQKIAAVIVEPIAGNMGVVLPANGFLEGLRELCNQNDSLLIFDEVISGFRVSKGGAQSLLDVHPDLTCLGKIIGGGLPVGAYGGAAEFMSLVAPMGEVYQAGTLSGNPLAMTAGLWSLKRLSNVLYRRLSRMSGRLTTGLTKAAKDSGVDVQVNSAGSLLTPFFTAKPVNDYHSAVGANTKKYAAFFHTMLGQGIYPPPSQFEAWFLSGAHTDQDVEHTIKASQKAMRAAKRA
jgi:glutamate-1-semialdehyde 2,1-aminomutase